MSVTPLALSPAWRDYWADWNAAVEVYAAPLALSTCHNPRYVMAPSLDEAVIGSDGKITFNFTIPAGSIIWGLLPSNCTTFQLTDVGLGHKLMQEPAVGDFMSTSGIDSANIPSGFILPTPWPVTGDGLFTLEIWGSVGNRVFLPLGLVL